MIITQKTLDQIRLQIQSLLSHNPGLGDAYTTANFQRALEVSVRDAFSKVVERMALADTEELAIQAAEDLLEKNKPTLYATAQSKAVFAALKAVLAIVRKRHERTVIRKSPGRVLHESFHSSLNAKGASKYGDGCWDQLSPERVDAWEAAAKQLATEVVYGRVQLQDSENRPIVGIDPVRAQATLEINRPRFRF